jgi:uncharacterized protein YndB with AHSA1/START domain
MNNKTEITKDFKEKSIVVSREFNAPVENVWRAYTEAELLDQWWGPAPWRAETKTMKFEPGGYWIYAMVGPENQKHWSRMNYVAIDHLKSFDYEDAFTDEEGNFNHDLPVSAGRASFTKTANGTKVDMRSVYPSESDLQKLIEMGFEQGISICFDQLATMLEKEKV